MQIFTFGLGDTVTETSPEVLGGKGAGLVWMSSKGVPVPPGFVLSVDWCLAYQNDPKGTMQLVAQALPAYLEKLRNHFGYDPLLSVRSGARVSMPGMMDTILNVGLDNQTYTQWVERIGLDCTTDSYKRLVEMYGSVVHGIDRQKFHGLTLDQRYALYSKETGGGVGFPQRNTQILGAVEAVFKSWDNDRAILYRQLNSIPNSWGTAVVVQAMVFGNMNDQSGTGVLFTRNPDSGEDVLMGEFSINAQGEDVVNGSTTPMPLESINGWNAAVGSQLAQVVMKLEEEKREVQDVEFTVENGKLYILQTRRAKTSPRAAVRIAVEMAEEGMITPAEMFQRVTFKEYLKAQDVILDPSFTTAPDYTGIAACSGVVTGEVVLSSEAAVEAKAQGKTVILVTQETTPDDLKGMVAAAGILTMTGGATSHAAVVARSLNKCCIVGLTYPLSAFKAGETLSLDGGTGRVWRKAVPVISGENDAYVAKLTALMAEKCSGLVDAKDGDLLDLSGYYGREDEAVAAVRAALKTHPHLIVDTRPDTSEGHKVFAAMFGLAQEKQEAVLVQTLGATLTTQERAALRLLTSLPKTAQTVGLQLVATCATAEDLVLAEGEVVLDLPKAAWVEKLLQLKGDSIQPLALGYLVDGRGYVSKAQLAAALLRR